MGTHLTTHVRTAVAGGVFIISVLALSMAGASAVGSLLHAAPLRSRVALYLAIGVALVALPQLLVPESPVHRASCAVAAAVGFVAGSAIVFALSASLHHPEPPTPDPQNPHENRRSRHRRRAGRLRDGLLPGA